MNVQTYYEVQGSPVDEDYWIPVYDSRFHTLPAAQHKLREEVNARRFPRLFRYRIVSVCVVQEVMEEVAQHEQAIQAQAEPAS